MCGRYKRKSDKQKVAQAFHVQAGLDETDFAPDDDLRPQSIQPIIFTNQVGERQIEMMRWGFKLPDRLLFNARSEAIAQANFWKDAFLGGRCIAPGDAVFEWKAMPSGQKKPKYEITIPDQEPFGMAAVWKLWKNPKTDKWEPTSAILTGEPNELMGPIHDRMTTFIEPRDYDEYLAPSERPPCSFAAHSPIGQDESDPCGCFLDYKPASGTLRQPMSKTPKRSAGLLMYRKNADIVEIFLVHPGGPYWSKKNEGYWTIPKGEYDADEQPLAAAIREFQEETGFKVSEPFIELGSVKQKTGKIVIAWAFEGNCDPTKLLSNTCEIEWPPRSGRKLAIPEVDRGGWFSLDKAREFVRLEQVPCSIGSVSGSSASARRMSP